MKDTQNLRQKIHEAVCQMYDLVSRIPQSPLHFPVGYEAAVTLGYPTSVLDTVPRTATSSFAGVAYHFKTNLIRKGSTVLDIGSGSGTDVFIASRIVGKQGQVVGIDITAAMVDKAKKAAQTNGFPNVKIIQADAEKIPFAAGSFDAVISNGVINLVPEKNKVYEEMYRVLKPGGSVVIADIVLGRPISQVSRQDPELWAECVVGALLEEEYLKIISGTGFSNIKIVERSDYFELSTSENTRDVARHYKAHAIVLLAMKGGEAR